MGKIIDNSNCLSAENRDLFRIRLEEIEEYVNQNISIGERIVINQEFISGKGGHLDSTFWYKNDKLSAVQILMIDFYINSKIENFEYDNLKDDILKLLYSLSRIYKGGQISLSSYFSNILEFRLCRLNYIRLCVHLDRRENKIIVKINRNSCHKDIKEVEQEISTEFVKLVNSFKESIKECLIFLKENDNTFSDYQLLISSTDCSDTEELFQFEIQNDEIVNFLKLNAGSNLRIKK